MHNHDAYRCWAYEVQPLRPLCAEQQISLNTTTPQEAGMPRGDELREEYRFSDRDDDADDLGYDSGRRR